VLVPSTPSRTGGGAGVTAGEKNPGNGGEFRKELEPASENRG
jgi:hypothetical protein